jgi:hypothetical protein
MQCNAMPSGFGITLACNAAHRHITQKSMEQKLLIKPETVSKQMKHKLPTIANQT